MQAIFSSIFSIFVFVVIGFIACRVNILPKETHAPLLSFVLNITTPCLILASVNSSELDTKTFSNTIWTLVLTLVLFVIFSFVSIGLSRLMKKTSRNEKNVLSVAMLTCNSGFMGLPVSQAAFGPAIFYLMVIQNLAFNVYLFTGVVMQFHAGEKALIEKRNIFPAIRRLLKPLFSFSSIMSFLAIFFLFAQIRIPEYPAGILEDIGNITVPLSMMIVGAQLGTCSVVNVISDRRLLYVSFCKLIIQPGLALLILYFLPIDDSVKLTIVLSFAFPAAVLGAALAESENKDSTRMAEAVATSTVLSMATLPIWIIILGALFPLA